MTPSRSRRLGVGLALILAAGLLPVQAATLFAVVTERAAPSTIEAAHRHLASHPGDKIMLRTPAQVMAADDKQLGQWIGKADSILAISVFGDPARRLKDALGRHARPQTPLLAMNGEASLNLMSRQLGGESNGSLAGFPAETLRQRADLRVAEQRVLAALARVEQADAARWPSFQLAGSLGLAATRPADLFELSSLTRTLLAGLSASLFDGGAARAQVRAQQAALEQSRLGYEAALLGALQQVEDALAALAGDRERLTRLQAAAGAAANAELLARQRYASGLIDFRTVLDTQRTLLSAQSELETTRAALSADHVRLYLALGGGWTPDAAPQP